MSDDSSTGPELHPAHVPDTRVDALRRELIEASGNYGLHQYDAGKLRHATTLLGLSAVRQRAEREALSPPAAALRIVRETVDAWPEARGRAILRSAFGFDHGSERGRENRLGKVATDLGEVEGADNVPINLDTTFTSHLARDLAVELLAGEPPVAVLASGQAEEGPEERTARPHPQLPLFIGGAIALLLLLGIGAFLLLRDEDLVFQLVPSRCPIDYCQNQERAIGAKTGGFTPGGVVRTEIFTPSGHNANDLGGLGTYRPEKLIDQDGQFEWRYWWDPGMEIGTYHVRITDEKTNRSIEADFEFY